MPRQSNNVPLFTYTDPLNMPRLPRENAESVISHDHPANNRNQHSEHNSTYTFRQRNVKLNFTLGWELEANHVPTRIPSGVDHISDGSVDGDGAEFVVLPAVTKSPRYVLGLLKDLVHAPRLNTNKSCGFHVHVSASNLSSLARMRQWAIATEHLALQVEDLAFKAVPDARRENTYCKRIVPITHGTSFQSHKYGNSRRYHWLNIVEMFRPGGIRTIEIRLLGNTHRWKYVLAWSLFSMELARRGWDVANKPFEVTEHVDALGTMLKNIAKDIKPLEKKLEPIPQWVYEGLTSFGIESNSWNRPLARLSETETDLRGLIRIPYSDNQPEEEVSRNSDEECECGCGTDGRCDSQLHSDSDCDSDYCEYCHEDGNCNGSPNCERCRDNRHEEGEDCGRSRCSTCHPLPRVVRPSSNVTIDSSGLTAGRVTTNTGPALTYESMQAAVNNLRNVTVDNANIQINRMVNDATLYGTGIPPMVWFDEYTVGEWVTTPQTFVEPTQETERRANAMLSTMEFMASNQREHSVSVITERANALMTPLERDASIERAEYVALNRGGR